MSESLYQQLKRLGIDEELAHQVSASLDPDYNASKKDVLAMQKAILQLQEKGDARYLQLQEKGDARYLQLQEKGDARYIELKTEMVNGFAELRSEMHTINRQFIFTFGGMIVTILSVLAINLYFH